MKKFSKTIAMLLVLVMLAGSFTGCTMLLPDLFAKSFLGEVGWTTVGLLLDIIVIASGAWLVFIDAELPDETEALSYLAAVGDYNYSKYALLREKFNSLPEEEQLAFTEQINSLPEAKRTSLVSDVKALPQTEINASMERINALTEAEFASVVQDFNSLNESEMDTLLYQLNQKAMYYSLMNSVAFTRKRTALEPVAA